MRRASVRARFPYTTLFRSDVPALPRMPHGVPRSLILLGATALGIFSTAIAWQFTRWLGREDAFGLQKLALLNFAYWYLDRKSTRLNSSHLVISYAVFCLKK